MPENPADRRFRVILALFLVLLAGQFVQAVPKPPNPLKAALGTARPFHGVALVDDAGKRVGFYAEGFADREKKIPLILKSRFIIGSISKQVTATLVLRQVDQGKLNLDDVIGKYLGENAPGAGSIRIRHLLNHSSGITGEGKPLASEPGKTFVYSNFNYILLSRVIEKVTGRPFPETVNELFRSLGMRDSFAAGAGKSLPIVAGYDEIRLNEFSKADPAEPLQFPASGGMVSTAEDLVKWTAALHGGKLLSKQSQDAMVTPTITRKNRWGEIGYGFGLQVTTNGGRLEYSHGGYVPGFQSLLLYYPETRRTVVILENVSWNLDDQARAYGPHDALRGWAVRN
jgi:CubicO group peptidase (beta-lactamase class C family)